MFIKKDDGERGLIKQTEHVWDDGDEPVSKEFSYLIFQSLIKMDTFVTETICFK